MSKAKRDISLARLDESYKNSVAYQYGLFAEKFTYDMLPEKVVTFAKTILLDSIGVMIGALDCEGFSHLSRSIEAWGGTKEATVSNRFDNLMGSPTRPDNLSASCFCLDASICAKPLPRSDGFFLW